MLHSDVASCAASTSAPRSSSNSLPITPTNASTESYAAGLDAGPLLLPAALLLRAPAALGACWLLLCFVDAAPAGAAADCRNAAGLMLRCCCSSCAMAASDRGDVDSSLPFSVPMSTCSSSSRHRHHCNKYLYGFRQDTQRILFAACVHTQTSPPLQHITCPQGLPVCICWVCAGEGQNADNTRVGAPITPQLYAAIKVAMKQKRPCKCGLCANDKPCVLHPETPAAGACCCPPLC